MKKLDEILSFGENNKHAFLTEYLNQNKWFVIRTQSTFEALARYISFRYDTQDKAYFISEYYTFYNAENQINSINTYVYKFRKVVNPTAKRMGKLICTGKIFGKTIELPIRYDEITTLYRFVEA